MLKKQMISPSTTIRKLIQDHYGICLPMIVMRLDDEIFSYQKQHHEVPWPLWVSVNHYTRILREWATHDPMIDIVIWEDTTQSYRLVQDVCFKNAYMDEEAWHTAVLELITNNPLVWIVKHLE